MTNRARRSIAMLIGTFLQVTTACSPRDQRPTNQIPPPPAVAPPEVSAMSVPVQTQVRAAYERLLRAKADLSTPSGDLATAYGELGKLLLAAESFADAEPCFLNAYALAPGEGRWSYYLAQVYRLQGDGAQSAAWFERVLQSQPENVAALVWLGNLYLDQGRPERAEPVFVKASGLDPRAVAPRFGLGRVALAERDYARAITELEAALALDRRATIIHYPLATAYRAAGRIEQATAHIRQKGDVEIGPPDPLMQELGDLLQSPVAYEARGDRALARSEFANALASFRKGLALAPERSSLRHKVATALSLTGDARGAAREFQEVLRRSPRFAPAHYGLGVLLLSNGEETLAREQFATAVENDPTYLPARLQFAHALRREGRFNASLRQYADLLARDPRMGEARLGHAIALVRLKRYQEARERLIEAVRLDPDRLVFVDTLARLFAAAPDGGVRNASQALALAQDLVRRGQTAHTRETMAMALAEAGQYDASLTWQRQAISAAQAAGSPDLARRMGDNLALYERHRPCRTPWRDDPVWDE